MTHPVRTAIIDAWREAVYPGDDRICSPTYDDEGVTAYFRGRTWEGHDVASLRYHSVGLSFFAPEGFAYYLAAYMLAVLDDTSTADVIYDGILFSLSPEQLGKQWADSYRARLARLTDPQRAAIVAYLEWCRDNARYGAGTIDETIEYLKTGQVRASVSMLDRVLQLAGVSDRDRTQLERLRLSHTTVTDADLGALRELPALRELDLGGAQITDAGLAELAEVTTLTALDLSGCKALTGAGFAHVATLPHLVDLKLPNVDPDDAVLQALAPARLRNLDLTHARRITDAGWAALDVSRLERIDMYGVDAADALLARMGACGVLRALKAKAFSDAGLVAVASAPLVELEIGAAERVTEAGLAALAQVPTLRELRLHSARCEQLPAGWAALETLTLLGMTLGATFAAGIGELPALRELRLFGAGVEPRALAAVARAPHLEEMTLWCRGAALALEELAGAAALKSLSITDMSVTRDGLSTLAKLPALATLTLDHVSPIADTDLRVLAVSRVEVLELRDVPIGDAGLSSLGTWPQLRGVRLARTQVTSAGLDAFRHAHPAIAVAAV